MFPLDYIVARNADPERFRPVPLHSAAAKPAQPNAPPAEPVKRAA
jgi:hypothetical protein